MKDTLQTVKTFVQELSNTHQFEIGDVVVWKGEEFKNKRKPELGQKAVVSYIYPQMVFSTETDGSPYDFEPITFRLAFIDKDGDMMEYAFDHRRFRLAD